MASHGAWHLGRDYATRKEYFRTLRDAYDLGSKAVHGTDVRFSKKSEGIPALLTAGRNLCREGILKRLDETEEPNWNELVLGKETEDEA